MTPDADRTRIRLEEVRAEVRTLETALPEPLTLASAIRDLTATLEAYDAIDGDPAAADPTPDTSAATDPVSTHRAADRGDHR